jgi:type VI secretion system protein ImpG
MNKRFLDLYEVELQHIRKMAAEFAVEHPKIAGRLALNPDASDMCPDPFVERLLEGFAFLTARVQLKLDAEFPRFTQGLLETVYPHYLSPLPATGIVAFEPDNAPEKGEPIKVGTILRTIPGKDEMTACTFRTAHPVNILPIRVAEVRYFSRDIGEMDLPASLGAVRAALRIRLETDLPEGIAKVELDELDIFLSGSEEVPGLIYEQLFAHAVAVDQQSLAAAGDWQAEKHRAKAIVGRTDIEQLGFGDNEALLPAGPASFAGYRLLREYFALPQRFLFVRLKNLKAAVKRAPANRLDIVIPFETIETRLERRVDASKVSLFCTPVINLFPKQLDEVDLTDDRAEYHVIPDRTRPLDFEVFELQAVEGVGEMTGQKQVFHPFYWTKDATAGGERYYAVQRSRRHLSASEKLYGAHSEYLGTELNVTLVDHHCQPYWDAESPFKKLRIRALCTNRHLPIQLAARERSRQRTDFDIVGAAVSSIRFVVGPRPPVTSFADGEVLWRLISHLSLNYLSLLERGEEGAAALREMLQLYNFGDDPAVQRQIDGLRSVASRPIIERYENEGPIALVRGLKITLGFDEKAFRGVGFFLLGAVLDRFFSKYVSINSFTRTVIQTSDGREVMTWPARIGKRVIL